MRVQHEDYEQFGFAPQANQQNATVYAMADTGCQSCLVSIDNVRKLGLHKCNLIPVKMRMHAANNDNINILGAAILRFSGQDGSGNVVETRQLVCVTDTSSQLFLCKEACIVLRMITDRFPTVGEVPVICAKKNRKPHKTIDFQPLNTHATRETHLTQYPFHQARSVPSNTKKTIFDAWNGCHSVPIRQEDRHYTTFITPWGRYRYRTAPQRYIASRDGNSRRYNEIVSTIPKKTKCIDDTLLWADNLLMSFHQVTHWLDICGRHGITLNPDKFRFAMDTVEFAGFEITPSSVCPC